MGLTLVNNSWTDEQLIQGILIREDQTSLFRLGLGARVRLGLGFRVRVRVRFRIQGWDEHVDNSCSDKQLIQRMLTGGPNFPLMSLILLMGISQASSGSSNFFVCSRVYCCTSIAC